MGHEAESARSLREFSLANALADHATVSLVHEFYAAVGPDMHPALKASRTPSALDAEVLRYNFDEGHAGRFTVPSSDGGSLDFEFVRGQGGPFEYMMRHLAFRDANTAQYSPDDEVVVFVPGLNTLHQRVEGETSMPDRCQFYQKVLQIPMAQLHTGTSFDQGDVRIDTSRADGLADKLRAALPGIPKNGRPKFEGKTIVWNARQIDNVQVTLSERGFIDTPVKANVRKLLGSSKDRGVPPFVVMGYSRGAVEVEAALREHVEESLASGERAEDMKRRLREKVTVVIIGGASRAFPDGPAYIHVSSWTDRLTVGSGADGRRPEGAGADAVFVNCESIYHADSFDNHNFGAITAQYLALVMAKTGARGYRELWELGQKGRMAVPDRVDEATRAMIQVTKGYKWIWNPDEAWKDIKHGALPNRARAVKVLREVMGDEYVGKVLKNFGE